MPSCFSGNTLRRVVTVTVKVATQDFKKEYFCFFAQSLQNATTMFGGKAREVHVLAYNCIGARSTKMGATG